VRPKQIESVCVCLLVCEKQVHPSCLPKAVCLYVCVCAVRVSAYERVPDGDAGEAVCVAGSAW
jgi:hypothetical protein